MVPCVWVENSNILAGRQASFKTRILSLDALCSYEMLLEFWRLGGHSCSNFLASSTLALTTAQKHTPFSVAIPTSCAMLTNTSTLPVPEHAEVALALILLMI